MSPAPDPLRLAQLDAAVASAAARLSAATSAREVGLAACRRVVRASGSSIRAVHRLDPQRAGVLAGEAEVALRQAQDALDAFPDVAHAGFLHDAEKEYTEARLTAALVVAAPVDGPDELGVQPAAWLKGLAEAASELRRHLLDRLRAGELGRAEELLAAMEGAYDALVVIDEPDAVTHGLRRTLDALRAVLERSRADVTTAVVHARVQATLRAHAGPG
ncbi:MAG: haloacid dehalogenase [Acidimicrobiales bacterium]|nr:haloacid dehalogenase [Acidimicrobiales bacterium]